VAGLLSFSVCFCTISSPPPVAFVCLDWCREAGSVLKNHGKLITRTFPVLRCGNLDQCLSIQEKQLAKEDRSSIQIWSSLQQSVSSPPACHLKWLTKMLSSCLLKKVCLIGCYELSYRRKACRFSLASMGLQAS
jgi:hypothetical protein